MAVALEIALQENSVTRAYHVLMIVQRRKRIRMVTESTETGQAQEIVRIKLFAIQMAYVVVCNIIII